MRTATTLHKTSKGWILKHDPDVPFTKQKAEFGAAVMGNWPKDVVAIRFQANEGKAKTLESVKGNQRVMARAQADQRAEAKRQKQIHDAREASVQAAIAELEPRIARERERVDIFKDKADRSKDTKWNPAFVREHKDAVELLASLEKQHAKLKAQLADISKPAPAPEAAAPAVPSSSS